MRETAYVVLDWETDPYAPKRDREEREAREPSRILSPARTLREPAAAVMRRAGLR